MKAGLSILLVAVFATSWLSTFACIQTVILNLTKTEDVSTTEAATTLQTTMLSVINPMEDYLVTSNIRTVNV
uniref:Col_cuticle_N domain-containing protein n=1 Tax=Panagrellus redivivus TaxID=6233 RepID=A0A7E4VDL9_PANRE